MSTLFKDGWIQVLISSEVCVMNVSAARGSTQTKLRFVQTSDKGKTTMSAFSISCLYALPSSQSFSIHSYSIETENSAHAGHQARTVLTLKWNP